MSIERLRFDELDDFVAWARADGWTVHRDGLGPHTVFGLSRPGRDVASHGVEAAFHNFGFLERFRMSHNTVLEVTAERKGAELIRAYKADRGHPSRPPLTVTEEIRGLSLRCLDLMDFIYKGQEMTRHRQAEVIDAERELSGVAKKLGLLVARSLEASLLRHGETP